MTHVILLLMFACYSNGWIDNDILFSGGAFKEIYSGQEHEHTVNNLSPGNTYKLWVACFSEGGSSEVSLQTKLLEKSSQHYCMFN